MYKVPRSPSPREKQGSLSPRSAYKKAVAYRIIDPHLTQIMKEHFPQLFGAAAHTVKVKHLRELSLSTLETRQQLLVKRYQEIQAKMQTNPADLLKSEVQHFAYIKEHLPDLQLAIDWKMSDVVTNGRQFMIPPGEEEN